MRIIRTGDGWACKFKAGGRDRLWCSFSLLTLLRGVWREKRWYDGPFWTFRVEISSGIGRARYADCSAGFFSRIGYVEVVQGVDITTCIFYRWLRIGIPRLGCLRIRLQKRAI